ncbi:MAG: hypothetical protein VX204_02105 [Candidatus Thermoplasmatota archaeon]|nr:hypothetical protein [Candidatus Thermoplasmatota archaeon]
MSVLGTGTANGGISVLHAAGLGKGCSVAIDLQCEARLVKGGNLPTDDHSGLLESVMRVWNDSGYPRFDGVGWEIDSQIPIGQGLKSSAAVACAAIRALDHASWTGLSDYEVVDIAVEAQRRSGCTITGSMDDAWAAVSDGWKLVDPSVPSKESVLMEGDLEEGLEILIGLRGHRAISSDSIDFDSHSKLFERTLASLSNGSILSAISTNGMAVSAAMGDDESLRLCNSLIVNGALAAGISGYGPAVVAICHPDSRGVGEILKDSCDRVIRTRFHISPVIDEEVNGWE